MGCRLQTQFLVSQPYPYKQPRQLTLQQLFHLGAMIMKSKLAKLTWPALLGGLLVLTGCGGGGGGGGGGVTYSGSTSPATVTATNAEDIGSTATEGVTEAIQSEEAANNNPFAIVITDTDSLSQAVNKIAKDIFNNIGAIELPVGVDLSASELNNEFGEQLFCGGSISVSNSLYNGSSSSGTITFHDLCIDIGSGYGQATMNGTVDVSSSSTSETITYRNVTVTVNGQTYTLNGTETCSLNYPYDCTMSQDYVSNDGSTYRVSDVDVSGDSTSGYYVNAKFYHPNYGYVTITTTSPVLFNCSNGYPSSGTVNFAGAGSSSGTITFRSDCSGYDGTYNTGTETGTFSGDWPA
jgi:hypothetical protein